MVGKFDGFHRGHQQLLHCVQSLAGQDLLTSVVLAFDMIPMLQAKGLLTGVLMERSEKRAYLEDKVDCFIDCPFDASISETDAADFVVRELAGRLHARHIVVGEDFRFGKDRRGDIALLEQMSADCGYELHVIPDVYRGEEKISSRYITQDLKAGRLDEVNEQLGHPWQIMGTVGHGSALGKKTFDMATINLVPDPVKALPPFGVYVVGVNIGDEEIRGVANIGLKPTVARLESPVVEVHLIDFDRDIYGVNVTISFYRFLREERRFDDVAELRAQMHTDLSAAEKAWKEISRKG